MSRENDDRRGGLSTGALLLLPALCCGLPLLIAAGALGTIGSVLGNPWVIGAAGVVVLGFVASRIRGPGNAAIVANRPYVTSDR
ncbi:MAG: hypothetical protein GEU78_20335 [Actinobacteria bacterium]|nr:hypothetical protein [Actinomycetota bacterium]